MPASYDYWLAALNGNFMPVHDGDAQPGFYRKRTSRAGPFVPVAIWEQDGSLIALVDGKAGDAAELWSYVCQHPVTEETYRLRVETGKWADEDAAVTESLAPPPSGHNQGPTDEAEILKGQIDAATAGAGEYAEITDDDAAKKAQSLRARLNELSGLADKKREAEKKPFFEAGKAVDARYQPLVKAAKAAADAIARALGAHETRKQREADRLAAIAEEARIKAERAAVRAAAAGKPAPPSPTPAPAPEAPVPAAKIAGAYGRAANVKEVKIATVTDQDAVYGYMKARPELTELLAKLAQRAVDAGHTVPGVTVTTEKKVI